MTVTGTVAGAPRWRPRVFVPGRLPRPFRRTVLPLAVLAAVLSLLPGAARWELDFTLLGSQPWRLLTGHLVHYSLEHLAWDLTVFVGLGVACEMQSRGRTAVALLLALSALAVGVPLLTPEIVTYRGLSGLDAALFALLAARCLRRPAAIARTAGAVALLALIGKVAWETVTGVPLFLGDTRGLTVIPAAHLLGGLAGLAAGLATVKPGIGRRRTMTV